jgi:hypothetical protein
VSAVALDLPAATLPHVAAWTIAATATTGVILRPWRVPEAAWALLGALLLQHAL